LAGAAETIQGVYSLKLGHSRAVAESTLAEDDRFRRIAGRFTDGFPLYETTLGDHELRVHPAFQDGTLVEIALRFREHASPNDVDPIIRPQVEFAVGALAGRFGEPDRVPIPVDQIEPGVFQDGERVVSHQWRRGKRLAEVALWRDRFTFGAAIVLAEQHTREADTSASEAF
jgi:hypothetical protein